jgi:hypothetical protein
MLEYFTYKKVKKHQHEKHKQHEVEPEHAPAPVLTPKDEEFLQRLTTEEASAPDQALTQITPADAHVAAPEGESSRGIDAEHSTTTKAKGSNHKWSGASSFLPGFLSKKDQKKAVKPQVNADGTVTPNEGACLLIRMAPTVY